MGDNKSEQTWEPDFGAKASSYLQNYSLDVSNKADFFLAVCQALVQSLQAKSPSSSLSSSTIEECIISINSQLSLCTVSNILCLVKPGSEAQKKLLCSIFNNGLKAFNIAEKSEGSSGSSGNTLSSGNTCAVT